MVEEDSVAKVPVVAVVMVGSAVNLRTVEMVLVAAGNAGGCGNGGVCDNEDPGGL